MDKHHGARGKKLAAKKNRTTSFLLASGPHGTKHTIKERCTPTALKGFRNFGDQMFNAAEKMAGSGWSHINRDEQGETSYWMNSDSTDPHAVFFVGISFIFFSVTVWNGIKRKHTHTHTPVFYLPVLVVPMFLFAFQHQKEADLRGSKKNDKDHGTMEEKSSINENSISFYEIHMFCNPHNFLESLDAKKSPRMLQNLGGFFRSIISFHMGLNYHYFPYNRGSIQ